MTDIAPAYPARNEGSTSPSQDSDVEKGFESEKGAEGEFTAYSCFMGIQSEPV